MIKSMWDAIHIDSTQSYGPRKAKDTVDTARDVFCTSESVRFWTLSGERAQYALMTQLFNYTNALLIKLGFSSLYFALH